MEGYKISSTLNLWMKCENSNHVNLRKIMQGHACWMEITKKINYEKSGDLA